MEKSTQDLTQLYGQRYVINMMNNELTTLYQSLTEKNEDEIYCDLIDKGFAPSKAYDLSRSKNWPQDHSTQFPATNEDVDPTSDVEYVDSLFDSVEV